MTNHSRDKRHNRHVSWLPLGEAGPKGLKGQGMEMAAIGRQMVSLPWIGQSPKSTDGMIDTFPHYPFKSKMEKIIGVPSSEGASGSMDSTWAREAILFTITVYRKSEFGIWGGGAALYRKFTICIKKLTSSVAFESGISWIPGVSGLSGRWRSTIRIAAPFYIGSHISFRFPDFHHDSHGSSEFRDSHQGLKVMRP